jgi:hypothetical protein
MRLERDGSIVRCYCRNPAALGPRVAPGIEWCQGDLLRPASPGAAFYECNRARMTSGFARERRGEVMNLTILGWIAASLIASAATPVAGIAVGDRLPPLQGEFPTGRTAILPQAASGRVALLMLGFTYDSRFPVEAWAKRFRQDFATDPRVTFFEIPMIGGLARMGKWFIDGGMRRNTPRADQEHVITVYGGTDAWKQRVGFRDSRAAYLILIDQNGNVVWLHAGDPDESPYRALSSEVSRLLAGK